MQQDIGFYNETKWIGESFHVGPHSYSYSCYLVIDPDYYISPVYMDIQFHF